MLTAGHRCVRDSCTLVRPAACSHCTRLFFRRGQQVFRRADEPPASSHTLQVGHSVFSLSLCPVIHHLFLSSLFIAQPYTSVHHYSFPKRLHVVSSLSISFFLLSTRPPCLFSSSSPSIHFSIRLISPSLYPFVSL